MLKVAMAGVKLLPALPGLPYGNDPFETAGVREGACRSPAIGIDFSVTDR